MQYKTTWRRPILASDNWANRQVQKSHLAGTQIATEHLLPRSLVALFRVRAASSHGQNILDILVASLHWPVHFSPNKHHKHPAGPQISSSQCLKSRTMAIRRISCATMLEARGWFSFRYLRKTPTYGEIMVKSFVNYWDGMGWLSNKTSHLSPHQPYHDLSCVKLWSCAAAFLSKLPKCCFGIRCHKHTNHEGNSHDRRSNACQHRNMPQLTITIEADENTESSGWTSIGQSDELKDIKIYAITDGIPKNPTLEAWTMLVTCTITSRL